MNNELKEILEVALLTTFGGRFSPKDYDELVDTFWGIVNDKLLAVPESHVSVTQVIDTVGEGSTVTGLKLDSL